MGARRGSSGLPLRQRQINALSAIVAAGAFSWLSPRVGDTSFPDRVASGVGARAIDANHTFNLASGALAIPAVAAQPLLNGQPGASFTRTGAGNFFDSSIGAANWKVHDGTGWEVHAVFASKDAAAGIGTLWSTRPAAVVAELGVMHQVSNALRVAVANGAAHIVDTGNVGAVVTNVATYSTFYYSETATPKDTLFQKQSSLYSTAPAGAPSSSNPAGTMRVGASSVGDALLGAWLGDVIWVKSADASALRTSIRALFALKYNL